MTTTMVTKMAVATIDESSSDAVASAPISNGILIINLRHDQIPNDYPIEAVHVPFAALLQRDGTDLIQNWIQKAVVPRLCAELSMYFDEWDIASAHLKGIHDFLDKRDAEIKQHFRFISCDDGKRILSHELAERIVAPMLGNIEVDLEFFGTAAKLIRKALQSTNAFYNNRTVADPNLSSASPDIAELLAQTCRTLELLTTVLSSWTTLPPAPPSGSLPPTGAVAKTLTPAFRRSMGIKEVSRETRPKTFSSTPRTRLRFPTRTGSAPGALAGSLARPPSTHATSSMTRSQVTSSGTQSGTHQKRPPGHCADSADGGVVGGDNDPEPGDVDGDGNDLDSPSHGQDPAWDANTQDGFRYTQGRKAVLWNRGDSGGSGSGDEDSDSGGSGGNDEPHRDANWCEDFCHVPEEGAVLQEGGPVGYTERATWICQYCNPNSPTDTAAALADITLGLDEVAPASDVPSPKMLSTLFENPVPGIDVLPESFATNPVTLDF